MLVCAYLPPDMGYLGCVLNYNKICSKINAMYAESDVVYTPHGVAMLRSDVPVYPIWFHPVPSVPSHIRNWSVPHGVAMLHALLLLLAVCVRPVLRYCTRSLCPEPFLHTVLGVCPQISSSGLSL